MKITRAVTQEKVGTLAGIPVAVERRLDDEDCVVQPMKSLANLITAPKPVDIMLAIRSRKEDIISQIVERMTGNRKEHAKLIALWANRYDINETDLHALLKKADDPAIRSFTAFVRWSIKDKAKVRLTSD